MYIYYLLYNKRSKVFSLKETYKKPTPKNSVFNCKPAIAKVKNEILSGY